MSCTPDKTQFSYLTTINTRWADNDIYGHVNNVTYYAFFDSAVNRYLINEGGLDIHTSPVIAFVVSSRCDYHAPIAYPEDIQVGVRVARLGTSSVTYQVCIFRLDGDDPIATGEFVHVFVNRERQASQPIPEQIRTALEKIQIR